MDIKVKRTPADHYGYQPTETNRGYQPSRNVNEGYQPRTGTTSTPPNRGSNVQPAKK